MSEGRMGGDGSPEKRGGQGLEMFGVSMTSKALCGLRPLLCVCDVAPRGF